MKILNFEKIEVFGLNEDNEKFLDHLESGESYELLKRNKTSILIKIGNTFFIILIVGKYLWFFRCSARLRQNITADGIYIFCRLRCLCLEISNNHKNVNGNKYDVLTNKNSKFLFYNFNDHLNRKSLLVQYVKRSIISEDIYVLLDLRKKRMASFYRKTHSDSWKTKFKFWKLRYRSRYWRKLAIDWYYKKSPD